jgi:hypothetical protein
MLELAAALCAGAAASIAVLCIALPAAVSKAMGGSVIRRLAVQVWLRESALAGSAGWPWLTGRSILIVEGSAGALGAAAAAFFTGLPALGVAGLAGAVALVRVAVGSRSHALRRERQDAVLEAVRMLRQLLETGAGTVQ